MSPHVWTLAEIKALPEFGADHGWFYGLVEDTLIDPDGEEQSLVALAEIYPGTGYAFVGSDELDQWPRILADITAYKPAAFDPFSNGPRNVNTERSAREAQP